MSQSPYSLECERCGASLAYVAEEGTDDGEVSCPECGALHYESTCCYGEDEWDVLSMHDDPGPDLREQDEDEEADQ